jgi:hypothetical protein
MAIISAIARGTTVLTLILLILAVVKQSVFVAGAVLLVLVKLLIIFGFVALLVSIIAAILRDRTRRKNHQSTNI